MNIIYICFVCVCVKGVRGWEWVEGMGWDMGALDR